MADVHQKTNATTVITFINEDYIQIGQNWLAAISALDIKAPIRIVALDAATRDAFPADIVLYRPCNPRSLAALWQHRIHVLNEILAESHSIIHSDADAIWLQNPLPILEDCGTEMIFSQGTIWPPDVHERQGLVLCCGFFYLANTVAVQDFFNAVERQMVIDQDDQTAINRLLEKAGVTWRIEAPYTIPFRNKEIIASRQIIRSHSGKVPSVAILPHHLFPRLIKHLNDEVMVCHPLAPKTCRNKIEVLSSLGLWVFEPDT